MTRQTRGKIPGSYRHAQSGRTKIPTDSDDQYMPDEERGAVMFWPEVRSEDGNPRLSWRRNTSQSDVGRKAYPLYIHEKVDPSWFINHLIDQTSEGQTHLFEFNGYPEDSKYSWYRHRGNWSNRLIRGDATRVMASLIERESMKGEVQMIYFDPPYGINFKTMFQVSTDKRIGATPTDGVTKKMFRDTYKDTIHSYLDSIYRVAMYARALLKDSGSFFLQIGSENVHRVSIVLDEVFGSENRISTIPFTPSGATSSTMLPDVTHWILWYAKDKTSTKYMQLYEKLRNRDDIINFRPTYTMVEILKKDGGKIEIEERSLTKAEKRDPSTLPENARILLRERLTSQHESTTGRSEPFTWNDVEFKCPPGEQWRVSHEGLERLETLNRLAAAGNGVLMWKRYSDEIPGRKINNLWHKQMKPTDMHFIVETSESVIERCMLMTTDPGDLVLDPTCGSGTTALVAERWGRRWITIDINPVQITLCRQRIITAVNNWYLTQDSREGRRKEAELAGTEPPAGNDAQGQHYDPSSGFVYERVPYVSAKTLAYDLSPAAVFLVDQPLKKHNMERISSPFTVEGISPHKYVNMQEYDQDQKDQFATVLEAIGIAGIIRPDSRDRWYIDDTNTWPNGRILTHEARLRGAGEKVAIVLLADDNTASVNLINHAAEEVAGYPGVKKLFILAFEFEATAYDRQTENRGRLDIYKIRINNDLALRELTHREDDASFVMLGEPDIDVRQQGNTKWTVEVKGYDTFNPETGSVSSGNADTVSCWMIDTNYDGQSFFARRMHLPGKEDDGQVKKLKKRLVKNINSDHWETMLSLKSVPFETPQSGRIAVRIITKHGDEMTTIHEVPPKTEAGK